MKKLNKIIINKIIINKIIINTIIFSCLIFNLTSADNSDCGSFGKLYYKQDSGSGFTIVNQSRETNNDYLSGFLSPQQQTAIIKKDDLNTALLNLKKYCCEQEKGGLAKKSETCKRDQPFYNDNSLDSPYLFDHLFDVIMRRLNGLTGDTDIYTKTNMSVDNKGLERRQWINQQATSTNGSLPEIINSKYKHFRQSSPAQLGYDISSKIYSNFPNDNDKFLDYVRGKDGENVVSKALQNYDKWTLYDRYINSCALSEYFYALLSISSESQDKIKIISSIPNCEKFISNQILGENQYTKLIAQRASNLFLSKYIEGYTNYLGNRQGKLLDLWRDSKNKRLDVVRGVPCLQRTCVK